MGFISEIFDALLFNHTKTYFQTSAMLISNPRRFASNIELSLPMPISSAKFLRSGFIYTLAVWTLSWFILKTNIQSFAFAVLAGLYIVSGIYIFSFMIWLFRFRNKPMSFTMNAHAYVIGIFLPLALIVQEIFEVCNRLIIKINGLYYIEQIIPIIFGSIAIVYLYILLRIVQKIKFIRFSVIILIFSVLNHEVLVRLFIWVEDFLRYYKYM